MVAYVTPSLYNQKMFDDDDNRIFEGPTGAGTNKSYDSDASDDRTWKKHWDNLDDQRLAKHKSQGTGIAGDVGDETVTFSIPGIRSRREPSYHQEYFTGKPRHIPSGSWIHDDQATRPYDNSGKLHEYQKADMEISRPISRVEFLEALHRGYLTKSIIEKAQGYSEDYYNAKGKEL